jgi:hypothetical protein
LIPGRRGIALETLYLKASGTKPPNRYIRKHVAADGRRYNPPTPALRERRHERV